MLKPIHLCCALVSVLVASSASAADRNPVASRSHCEPGEQIVFSCLIGQKIASLCASKRLTPTEGHVQYRYGPPGKVEIDVPGRSQADRARIKVLRSPPSSANAMAVGIESGGFTYHVFSSESVGSVSDGMRSWVYDSGVEVHKGQRTVFSKHCTGQPNDARFLASFFLDAAFQVETSAEAWDFGRREPDLIRDSKSNGR
jgi:hypothetical protein